MEDDQESVRLDRKTDGATVEKQALWAGIKPGMRVADLGCGAGKTTFHLNKLIQHLKKLMTCCNYFRTKGSV